MCRYTLGAHIELCQFSEFQSYAQWEEQLVERTGVPAVAMRGQRFTSTKILLTVYRVSR